MNIQEEIKKYISSQPEIKKNDMERLHNIILQILPKGKLWFDNGKNSENKTITNPTIGYGAQNRQYANGKTSELFQIGMSANKSGITIYILGIEDKSYLANTYGEELGKASVTGYCIKFKKLEDIDINVLESVIKDGVKITNDN